MRKKQEQARNWQRHRLLYYYMYYMKTGRLEFYSAGEENRLLVCQKDHECV